MATDNFSSEETALPVSTDRATIATPEMGDSNELVAGAATSQEPQPTYVKLAMRNMVRKRGKSLQHFFLTTAALLGLFVGLSYLTR